MGVRFTKEKDYWKVDGSVMGQRIRRRLDKSLSRAHVQKIVDTWVAEAVEEALELRRKYPRKTVADACQAYLRARKSLGTTSINYVRRFSAAMGRHQLTDVTGPMVVDWARNIGGVSDATKRGMLKLARAVMNYAIELGWCPVIRVHTKEFRDSPIRTRFLSEAEEEALLLWAPEYIWPLLVMALNTGARGVELRRAKWEDITEVEGRMLIKLRHRKGVTGDWRERFIPLNPRARAAVAEQARLNGQNSVPLERRRGFVFRNLWGEPWKSNLRISEVLLEASERAGLADVKMHDLRRTFASRMVARGVDMRTVAELLGHSNLALMERYAHLSPGVADAAVEML